MPRGRVSVERLEQGGNYASYIQGEIRILIRRSMLFYNLCRSGLNWCRVCRALHDKTRRADKIISRHHLTYLCESVTVHSLSLRAGHNSRGKAAERLVGCMGIGIFNRWHQGMVWWLFGQP